MDFSFSQKKKKGSMNSISLNHHPLIEANTTLMSVRIVRTQTDICDGA